MPAKSAQATNFTRQLCQFTSEPSTFGVWNAKRVSRVQNTTSCSCHAAKALESTAAEPLDHIFLLLHESNRGRRYRPSLLRQRTSPANFASLRQNRRRLVFGMPSGFLVSRIPPAAAAMLQRLSLGSTAAEPLDHTFLLLHESNRGRRCQPRLLRQRTSPANFPSLRQNRRCLVFGMPSGFLVSRMPLAAAAMLQRLWGQLPPNHWITRSCSFTRATEAEDASHVCLGNELHPPTFPVYVRTVDVWCLECQAGFSCPEYH